MAKSESVKKREQKLLKEQKRKKRLRRILAAALAVGVAVCAVLFYRSAGVQDGYVCEGAVSCGSYPQTLVRDAALLGRLSQLTPDWQYYDDCFAGSDFYGTMRQTPCMKYADVSLDGERYRAVMLEQYRPAAVIAPALASESAQDDNGFAVGETYWFRFEPIVWLVFNGRTGFAVTEKVLDAAPFCDSLYWIDRNLDGMPDYRTELSAKKTVFLPANLYKTSTVRAWLNRRFCAEAFTREEKRALALRARRTDESPKRNRYALLSLNFDKVFLPSLRSVAYDYHTQWDGYYTAFGNGEIQFAPATDYARCRGVRATEEDGTFYTWQWTSTPGDYSADAVSISTGDRVIEVDRQFYYTYMLGGIRCAAFFRDPGALPAVERGSAE